MQPIAQLRGLARWQASSYRRGMEQGHHSNPRGPGVADGGALAPFRFPAFRAIWTANLGSNVGYIMQAVGAAWLMTDLTPSHQMVALVQASTSIPIMVLGLFAGSLADNFDRRRVMIGSQLLMLLGAVALSALTWFGLITPWLLLGLTLLSGAGTAINSPAWQASVRLQVDLPTLPRAVALNSISFNMARTVGPALGGALISVAGVSAVFLFNALSRPPLLAVLMRWKPEIDPPQRRPTLPSIAEGLRFCMADSAIRRVLLHGILVGFGIAGYQALVPAVVRGPLHGTELSYGVLLAMFGLGSVLAAMTMDRARRRFGYAGLMAVAAVLFAAGSLGLAGAGSMAMAVPSAVVAGLGWVVLMTGLNVVMQMIAPEAMLGRCLSVYQATTFTGMAVGSWFWGAVADLGSLGLALRAGPMVLLIGLLVLRFVAPMPDATEMRAHRGR